MRKMMHVGAKFESHVPLPNMKFPRENLLLDGTQDLNAMQPVDSY
jgi:hypothetical protein